MLGVDRLVAGAEIALRSRSRGSRPSRRRRRCGRDRGRRLADRLAQPSPSRRDRARDVGGLGWRDRPRSPSGSGRAGSRSRRACAACRRRARRSCREHRPRYRGRRARQRADGVHAPVSAGIFLIVSMKGLRKNLRWQTPRGRTYSGVAWLPTTSAMTEAPARRIASDATFRRRRGTETSSAVAAVEGGRQARARVRERRERLARGRASRFQRHQRTLADDLVGDGRIAASAAWRRQRPACRPDGSARFDERQARDDLRPLGLRKRATRRLAPAAGCAAARGRDRRATSATASIAATRFIGMRLERHREAEMEARGVAHRRRRRPRGRHAPRRAPADR